MSAFVVSNQHIAALVSWWNRHNHGEPEAHDPERVANVLLAENVKSVCHRYSDPDSTYEPITFAQIMRAPKLEPVAILKACQCLDYQSCEHPTWKQSEAYRLLARIKSESINRLPGYKDAAWEVRP